MTREQWLRVKTITAAALEQPETTRDTFVVGACGGDDQLEQEVRSLVASAVSATPLFERPVFATAAVATAIDANRGVGPQPGERIGSYRILKEIGRGGMGTVFLAERADHEYHQHVAVKIAHGSRSADVLRWFREERQILASLEHPHIARLMDGGTTDQGVPYLVMENVDGVPVDEYCLTHGLTIRQRLELFETICAAVDVAHRNLIVHRDLKPRNILVSGGVPKLLDFGIAKLLDTHASAASTPAQSTTGPPLLTPEYASPEQLKRDAITTATDVYALGVLLYRLLTNRSPYNTRSDAPHELAAAICDQEPTRPSAVVPPRQLRRQLSGDLDKIILKALKKNPASRYSSAGAFGDDIHRYLRGLPIAARDDAWLYRGRKFIVRHRLGVTAAALVVLSLFGGLAVALSQAREAERQRALAQRHFDDVRRLASSLIFEVQDSIENVPGTVATRELLVRRALEYFDGLAAEETDNVGLQRELAQAYDKLGNVLGRAYGPNVGDTAAALASYQKALAIRQRLAKSGPAPPASQLDLWSSYLNVGGILRETAATNDAVTLHQNAAAVVGDLLRTSADDLKLLRAAAQTDSTLSLSYVQAGHLDRAADAARQTLALDERLLLANPADLILQNEVATARGRLGQILLKLGALVDARAQFEPAFATASKLVAAQPDNVAFRRRLSSTNSHLAQLFVREGDLQAAWPHQQMALSIRQALASESPADRQASIDLMVSQLETGQVLARRRDFAAAITHYRLALARGEPMIADHPSYV